MVVPKPVPAFQCPSKRRSMAARKDYYRTLGVDRDASDEEIRLAYRRLALKHHPDKCKHPDATKKFQDISEAYSILSDPSKRRRYDLSSGTLFSNFNDDFHFTSFGASHENFTMDDAFDVFSDFMYGGQVPDIFREENTEYHQIDVPWSVARDGGDIEIYLERGNDTKKVHISGVCSGRWKPFITLSDNDVAILRVSFPPEMSLAERRRQQKIFLGLHAVSLVSNVVSDIIDNHPVLGAIGLGIGAAALFLFSSR